MQTIDAVRVGARRRERIGAFGRPGGEGSLAHVFIYVLIDLLLVGVVVMAVRRRRARKGRLMGWN